MCYLNISLQQIVTFQNNRYFLFYNQTDSINSLLKLKVIFVVKSTLLHDFRSGFGSDTLPSESRSFESFKIKRLKISK